MFGFWGISSSTIKNLDLDFVGGNFSDPVSILGLKIVIIVHHHLGEYPGHSMYFFIIYRLVYHRNWPLVIY